MNAADHKQRDKSMTKIEVEINTVEQWISVQNDGNNGM